MPGAVVVASEQKRRFFRFPSPPPPNEVGFSHQNRPSRVLALDAALMMPLSDASLLLHKYPDKSQLFQSWADRIPTSRILKLFMINVGLVLIKVYSGEVSKEGLVVVLMRSLSRGGEAVK